jgi:hypothetical protein
MPPTVGGEIAFVATAGIGSLIALDMKTGAVLWRRAIEGRVGTAPLLDGRQVCLGTDRGLAAYSVLDGAHLWTAEADPPGCGVIARAKGTLVYTGVRGGLVVLDAKDGGVRKVLPDAEAKVSPLVTNDGVLYASKDSLMFLGWKKEKAVQWMDTSWLGRIVSSPIMGESMVFFAVDRYGVVCAGKSSK